MNRLWIFAYLIVLFHTVKSADTMSGNPKKQLLYIMIDAFRYDYLNKQPPENLPGFNKFLLEGVKAEWMTPIFPSISYPDWTTLVTGLWPESHGIVGNFFYDPEDKDMFHLGKVETTGREKWWTAEPIWTTSTKAGKKTGIIRWSRCDVPFGGILPEYCAPFLITEQDSQSFRVNTEAAIELLEKGYHFVQLYTPFIDTAGHYEGPESEGTKRAVRSADKTVLYLLEQLESKGLTNKVNIVLVSDHGMKNVHPSALRHVELDDYLNINQVESIAEYGALCNIKVLPGLIQTVYEDLRRMPGVEVYLHDNIPEELHYKDHKYIHDIIIKADEETFIQGSRSPKQIPNRNGDSRELLGAHGFDPREEKMRGIFFAKGPDFFQNVTIKPIQNVDVYPLLAYLLEINGRPNNGSIWSFSAALSEGIGSTASFTNVACSLPMLVLFLHLFVMNDLK